MEKPEIVNFPKKQARVEQSKEKTVKLWYWRSKKKGKGKGKREQGNIIKKTRGNGPTKRIGDLKQ